MMDKNKYKTLSIALEKEILEKLNEYCEHRTLKSIFVRRLIKRELERLGVIKSEVDYKPKGDTKIIKIKVDNYSELKEYSKTLKFGSISSLCTYSVQQMMNRYPKKNKKEI